MCGIIGFNWNDDNLLNRILKKIEHRGPDDFGKYTDKNISLGHRRLSILDLSKSGKQPMTNEDGTIFIIFNGEIYNYKGLKDDLIKKGHRFNSNTDTEVLIHLYEESKDYESMLSKLIGMFAFCIYDTKKKLLFLARDRVGIKPLYYYKDNSKFIFCSEIKGILEDKEIRREVNLNGLSSLLSFRANVNEETCFSNIFKIPPGNYILYNLKDKSLIKKTYWKIKYSNKIKNESYIKDKLQELLNDSVRLRLQSDVPYGAYLSGGIDSGSIVSIMKKFCNEPIETFSVGFNNREFDELEKAKIISEHYKTNHHELIVDDSSIKHLPDIIYQQDEPMSDPTSIPIYLLSKFTKKYSTVILTGEGADEVFAGYPQYKFMKLHKYLIRNQPNFIRKNSVKLFSSLPNQLKNNLFEYTTELGKKGFERLNNFINSNNTTYQYLNQISIFNEEEKAKLLNEYKENYYKKYNYYFKNNDLTNNCLNFDFNTTMVDDLLMKVDKNTMAFSIEGRVPFLDHRIVELASSIPSNLKLKNFTKDKYILREIMKNKIPNSTRLRKKKHFFVPINTWFKNELLEIKNDLLSKKFIEEQGIFNFKFINNINNNFNKSRLYYSRQLWTLLTFQIWYKQYIKNEKVKIT